MPLSAELLPDDRCSHRIPAGSARALAKIEVMFDVTEHEDVSLIRAMGESGIEYVLGDSESKIYVVSVSVLERRSISKAIRINSIRRIGDDASKFLVREGCMRSEYVVVDK